MDPVIYFVADLYPWWGVPLAFIFFEVANRCRRRHQRKWMMIYLSLSAVFGGLSVAYFVFNGFSNLRPAMEQLDKNFLEKK